MFRRITSTDGFVSTYYILHMAVPGQPCWAPCQYVPGTAPKIESIAFFSERRKKKSTTLLHRLAPRHINIVVEKVFNAGQVTVGCSWTLSLLK